MTRRLAILLALGAALAAAPAWGATYWVSPTGSAGASGADSTTNATTLTWFNENAQPGDICRFKSGDYGTEAISMQGSNRKGRSDARIAYYGLPADPQGVRVANIQLGNDAGQGGDYVTVRWVKTTSAFTGVRGATEETYPWGDSLVRCISSVANSISLHGRYHVMDSLTLSGTMTTVDGTCCNYWFNVGGATKGVGNHCLDGPFSYDRFTAVSNAIKNSTLTCTKAGTGGEFMAFHFIAADSLVFFNNTITVTNSVDSQGYFFGLGLFDVRHAWFQNNSITIAMSQPNGGTRGGIMCRDFTYGTRFFGNTITTTGTPSLDALRPADGGSCDVSVEHNYYGFNTIKCATPQNAAFYYQAGARGDTIQGNTVACNAALPALAIIADKDHRDLLVTHNSFWTTGTTAVGFAGTHAPVGQNRIAGNAFYTTGTPTSAAALLTFNQGVEFDSAGVFFAIGAAASASYAIDNGGTVGVPGGTQRVWGTPTYKDSAYATLDARVTSAFATGSEWHDGFAGKALYNADGTEPVAVVTFPAAGDTNYLWTTQETMNVAWTSSDATGVTSVDLDWGSGENPTSWTSIATGQAEDDTYAWTLPAISRGYATFRVRARDTAGNVGVATRLFRMNVSESGPRGLRDVP